MSRDQNNPPLTQEEFARMEAAEWEITTVYGSPERRLGERRPANRNDEEIVRAFLKSRTGLWRQLPYDWLEMGDEDLHSWSLLEIPDAVRQAYDRSRVDPAQRAEFEADYGRQVNVDTWAEVLEQEAKSSR